MMRERLELLQDELVDLQLAASHLGYSIERCRNLIGRENLSPDELERLESLTSRFARLADICLARWKLSELDCSQRDAMQGANCAAWSFTRKQFATRQCARRGRSNRTISTAQGIIIQRIFRLIDEIELTGAGTILDRIYRAEKRGWADAAEIIGIRELRNLIAHEYANDKMPEIHASVAAMSPALLAVVPKVIAYADNINRKYPA